MEWFLCNSKVHCTHIYLINLKWLRRQECPGKFIKAINYEIVKETGMIEEKNIFLIFIEAINSEMAEETGVPKENYLIIIY